MKHFHHCPSCYERKSCEMDCTIEPDLEDPISHPGKQFGAHCECDDCKKVVSFNAEWFLKYNGFI